MKYLKESSENAMYRTIDADIIRKDFPIFQRMIHGKRLVYLDSAATSQKPISVIKSIDEFYRMSNANIHRGAYLLSEESTILYENAKKRVSSFIGAKSFREIIFTRNTTEAINLVAYSWGRKNITEDDTIVISEMEHHSNIVPWQILSKEKGCRLLYVPFDKDGMLDLERLEGYLKKGVKLLSITHVSNVLGTVNPVHEICRMAKQYGTTVLIDAAQSVPHMKVDVSEIGCDFLAFSAHKMLGPTGIGVLFGRRELLEEMEPFITGGDMISNVSFYETRWNELPWKFEGGTPNISGAVGLSAAIEYLDKIGMERVYLHEREITKLAWNKLSEMEGIEIYGPVPEKRGGLIAFNIDGIHPHDIATILDREGIAVRAGHHCAQPLHERLGIPASVRASFYIYNTEDDVDALIHGLKKAKSLFGT